MLWIGIDEAGYGPNLGPLVMTAVAAEGPGRPDCWADLPGTISRAGGPAGRLWVDDSKVLYRGGKGFDRLEAAALATLDAAGLGRPATFEEMLAGLGVPVDPEAELRPWLEPPGAIALPRRSSLDRVDRALRLRAFAGAPWRVVALRSVVVGPSRFNRELSASGSKAAVHFAAFARLIDWALGLAGPGRPARVRGDKHGGRHFYAGPLRLAFPALRVEPGPEGPSLSRYTLADADRRLDLELVPRADADDGLVALAGVVSKVAREHWMAAFNSFWARRVPGLRPSAGYPVDAARFRRDLEAALGPPDPPLDLWWRSR